MEKSGVSLMDKRGAYFFVIDAIIASAVLVAGIIFIFAAYPTPPDPDSSYRSLQDYMSFLESTKLRELPGNTISNLVASGDIKSTDITIEDQVLLFSLNGASHAFIQDFMKNVSMGAVSADRNVFVTLDDGVSEEVVYNRSWKPSKSSSLFLSSRHIAFTKINESYLYGPVLIEVKLWV
jgi:hypothetical protein